MTQPRIAIHGEPMPFLTQAIEEGGALLVGKDEAPDALALDHRNDFTQLPEILRANPSVKWVQLPYAGVDAYLSTMAEFSHVTFTSAKGAYSEPVAEHTLALTLAVARHLKERSLASAWAPPAGISLYGLNAVVVGAGGLAIEIVRLLNAVKMNVTVVRRTDAPAEGAARTVTFESLDEVLPEADVVILASALTPTTRHMINAERLAAMKAQAILVNIGRGPLIDTEALVESLASGHLYGVALDVTDPEPLPEGHPLWADPRCLITPHTADTPEMIRPLLGARLQRNIKRFVEAGLDPVAAGFEGVVDVEAGYYACAACTACLPAPPACLRRAGLLRRSRLRWRDSVERL